MNERLLTSMFTGFFASWWTNPVVWETKRTISKILSDVEERKRVLSQCDWMTDTQRQNIDITSGGIQFIKEWITLSLYDEAGKYNFQDAQQYSLLTEEDWKSILDAIRWDDTQKKKIFQEVLQMNGTCYWTSSQKPTPQGNFYTFLSVADKEVKTVSWHHHEVEFSLRTLASKNL